MVPREHPKFRIPPSSLLGNTDLHVADPDEVEASMADRVSDHGTSEIIGERGIAVHILDIRCQVCEHCLGVGLQDGIRMS